MLCHLSNKLFHFLPALCALCVLCVKALSLYSAETEVEMRRARRRRTFR